MTAIDRATELGIAHGREAAEAWQSQIPDRHAGLYHQRRWLQAWPKPDLSPERIGISLGMARVVTNGTIRWTETTDKSDPRYVLWTESLLTHIYRDAFAAAVDETVRGKVGS